MTRPGKFREPSATWATKDYDTMNVLMFMDGRVSIPELLQHLAEVAPGKELADFQINASVNWQRDPTPEEQARLAAHQAKHDERHEKWERAMHTKLVAKYGPAPIWHEAPESGFQW